CGERGLDAGMTSADDDDVVTPAHSRIPSFENSLHDQQGTVFRLANLGRLSRPHITPKKYKKPAPNLSASTARARAVRTRVTVIGCRHSCPIAKASATLTVRPKKRPK